VFIHDWQATKLRIVVRGPFPSLPIAKRSRLIQGTDSRLREHDPILGIINLPLKEILANSSEVTRLFSLQDGVGFGRVNVSILFKGVQIDLPKNLRGWDTGTVCVTAPIKVTPTSEGGFEFKEKKLVLSTLEATQKVSGKKADLKDDGTLEYAVDKDIRLPTCLSRFLPLLASLLTRRVMQMIDILRLSSSIVCSRLTFGLSTYADDCHDA
jgi:hypothetical protein